MVTVAESRYLSPRSLDDALATLAAGGVTVVAGGTDVYPALVGRDLPADVLDISAVSELQGIASTPDGLRIGAGVTWADIAAAALPPGLLALQQAARQVGAVQVQKAGTVAGNLCTASPAGDGIPALLALDARIELASMRGIREMPLDHFVTGYRATAKAADELVTAIVVPREATERISSFVKLGTRAYLVISLAMVAASVGRDDRGRVTSARVAVGACSPVARRLASVEAAVLSGGPVRVATADLHELSPIDDIRCSAAYRLDVVPELVRRALIDCGVDVE
jgi:CO/xanthine dehydrogenase FAD-binding subunit